MTGLSPNRWSTPRRVAAWLAVAALLFVDLVAPLTAARSNGPATPGTAGLAVCTPDGIVYVVPGDGAADPGGTPGEAPVPHPHPCILCLIGSQAPALLPRDVPMLTRNACGVLRRRVLPRMQSPAGRPIRRPGRPRDPPVFR